MSYDIYLEKPPCPTCGHHEEHLVVYNPTYNLTPIFDLALTGEPLPNETVSEAEVVLFGKETYRPRGLRVLSGRRAADTVVMVELALARCASPDWRHKLLAIQPDNGWGTLDGAEEVLRGLIVAAKEHPDHLWKIH
jgi:hypothetical protein